MPETVFADNRLRATLHAPDAEKLVVTFDNRKLGKTDFEPRAPAQNFLNAGFAQLHIETAANDWFVNGSSVALERMLMPLRSRYAKVRAIGFSMGGYGVLRFSGALGISEAALISPQIGLDRNKVPWETRFKREARRFDSSLGALATANTALGGVICYDPFHPLDTAHAALITAAFPAIRRVPMALGQHPATSILRENRAIGAVLRQVVRGFDAPALRARHRQLCQQTPLYWERLAQHAAARHPQWSARATQRAQDIRAKNP